MPNTVWGASTTPGTISTRCFSVRPVTSKGSRPWRRSSSCAIPARPSSPLRQIAKSTPDADSLTNLGVALLLRRRYGEAEENFRQALKLQPGSLSASLNLADCQLLQGRGAEARTLYSGIVADAERGHRNDWQSLGNKAQALAHLGKPALAVEAIQQALRLTPDNAQLAYEAAVVYTIIGDQSSALYHARIARAGGVDAYWFAIPFFDSLRARPEFQTLASRASKQQEDRVDP